MSISSLSRTYLAALLLLTAAFAAVVVDARTQAPSQDLARIAAVTRLPGAAISVSYLEPRWILYEDGSEVVHPNLAPVNHQKTLHAR